MTRHAIVTRPCFSYDEACVVMNFEWKFAVFALNLMTWFQERVKLLVAPILELLNIIVLEHKAGLRKFLLKCL